MRTRTKLALSFVFLVLFGGAIWANWDSPMVQNIAINSGISKAIGLFTSGEEYTGDPNYKIVSETKGGYKVKWYPVSITSTDKDYNFTVENLNNYVRTPNFSVAFNSLSGGSDGVYDIEVFYRGNVTKVIPVKVCENVRNITLSKGEINESIEPILDCGMVQKVKTFEDWIKYDFEDSKTKEQQKNLQTVESKLKDDGGKLTILAGETRNFKLKFKTKMTTNPDGTFGFNGNFEGILDGLKFHPTFNSSFNKRYVINFTTNDAITTNYTHKISFDLTGNETELGSGIRTLLDGNTSLRCSNFEVIYQETTSLNRWIDTCNTSAFEIHFKEQVGVGANTTILENYTIYYDPVSSFSPNELQDFSQIYRLGESFDQGHNSTLVKLVDIDPPVSYFINTSGNGHIVLGWTNLVTVDPSDMYHNITGLSGIGHLLEIEAFMTIVSTGTSERYYGFFNRQEESLSMQSTEVAGFTENLNSRVMDGGSTETTAGTSVQADEPYRLTTNWTTVGGSPYVENSQNSTNDAKDFNLTHTGGQVPDGDVPMFFQFMQTSSSGTRPNMSLDWFRISETVSSTPTYSFVQENFTIAINIAPTIDSVDINSTDPTVNNTDQNITIYPRNVADDDDDKVKNITNWFINGSSWTILNMLFEGGSNATFTRDYSGINNTGKNNGSVTGAFWNLSGGFDGFGAYEFDGVSDYITTAVNDDSFASGDWSITAWVKTDDLNPANNKLIVARHADGTEKNLQVGMETDNTFMFNTYDDCAGTSVGMFSTQTLTIGTWYHVTFVLDDGVRKYIYINGAHEVNSTSTPDVPLGCGQETSIGANLRNPSTTSWNGTIDDVMIFNRSLTPEQIEALYLNRTDLIVSQETRRFQNWSACVTPNDATIDGSTVCSENMSLGPPAPTLDLFFIDSYALNSSGGRIDEFNTTNLEEIEKLNLNFTLNITNGAGVIVDTWYLNFTANSTSACSLGNRQSANCFNESNSNASQIWIQFINNTITATYDAFNMVGGDEIVATSEASGSNFTIGLTIDEHYNPNVFKHYEALMNFSNRTIQNGTSQRITGDNMIKVEINNTNIPINADRFKLDFRVNVTGSPTQQLHAHACNSSYTIGNPHHLPECILVAQKAPSELQDDGTKFRAIFTDTLITGIGDLKYIVLMTDEVNTSNFYSLNTFGITEAGHTQFWEFSTNNGTSWANANDGFETELNINWFDSIESGTATSFKWIFGGNLTNGASNNISGNVTWDINLSVNLPPLVDLILPAINDPVDLPYNVTFVTSDPNVADNLNVSLFIFKNSIFNETLVSGMNQTNTTFNWTGALASGEIELVLEACELGTPELFCVNITHPINSNPVNLTDLVFFPLLPKTNETVNTTFIYNNGDDDLADITSNWSVDGVQTQVITQEDVVAGSLVNFTLLSTNYAKGQNVSIIINATDIQGFNGSIESSFIVGDVPPNMPTIDLVGNDTFNHVPSILINWTNITDIDNDVVQFEIYISTNQTLNLTTLQANSTALEFNYSTIPEGVNYYKVRANSDNLTSTFTETLVWTQDTSTIKNFTQAFLSPVVELSTNPFNITIQVNNATVTNLSINLTYNFTSFVGIVTHPTNETFFANFNIPTPVVLTSTNITFGYNVSAELFNSTSESNQSITTFGQIVNPINFFQCSIVNATSFQIYNFTMVEEDFMNTTLINTTTEASARFDAHFILWQDGNGGIPNKTVKVENVVGKRSTSVCIDQDVGLRVFAKAQYNADLFDTREWYTIGNYSIINNSNVTELNLYPIGLGSSITITIQDELLQGLAGVMIDVLRQNIGNASFVSVSRGFTDENGQENMFLREDDIFYKFRIYNFAGDLLKETPVGKILSTTITIPIFAESFKSILDTFAGVTFTFTNSSNQIFLIYNDTTGGTNQHCLRTYRIGNGTQNFLSGSQCNSCTPNISATLTCNIDNTINGTIVSNYYSSVNPTRSLAVLYMTFADNLVALVGINGILVTMMLMGAFAMIGSFNPVAMVALPSITLIGTAMLGIISWQYAGIITLLALGVFIIFRIKS